MSQQSYPNKIIVSGFQLNLCLLIILPAIFFSQFLNAQNFHLVKDINANTNGYPSNSRFSGLTGYTSDPFAVLNNVGYFSANDSSNTVGLWRTDGTIEGTFLVKNGINPENIITSNGKLFFAATGTTGLWTSDGTEAGTKPVLDSIPNGLYSFIPGSLTDVNGTVFFSIGNSQSKLWKTDGTKAGTMLVKELLQENSYYSYIENCVAVKDKLYFFARITNSDYSETYRLFVSDGSAEGTRIVSNTAKNPLLLTPASLNNTDSSLYFTSAPTRSASMLLYTSKGYADSAKIANGFTGVVTQAFYNRKLITIGGTVYYIGKADTAILNESLYKYDKVNGTQPVKIFTGTNTTGGYTSVTNLEEANGQLFFSLFDAPNNVYQLWKSDGTTTGTVLLKNNFTCDRFIAVNNIIFFVAKSEAEGFELWKTDGTSNGTVMVRDINPGAGSGYPASLTGLNNKLIFTATENIHGSELWQSDGGEAGTVLLKDINQYSSAGSNPSSLAAVNNQLFFTAFDGNASKLFKSDGSNQGTTALSDSLYPQSAVIPVPSANNQGLFWGVSAFGKKGICKTDGSSAGTVLIKDFTGSSLGFNLISSTNESVFFYFFNTLSRNYELWRTDGTTNNTLLVKDDFKRFVYSENITAVANKLFFVTGFDLWVTDGTLAGTSLIKTFTNIFGMKAFNGALYFGASDGLNSNLWKSDGTANGTVKITDNVTSVYDLFSSETALFFLGQGNTGIYGSIGKELYKTDGTQSGTTLVKDIHPGTVSTDRITSITLNNSFFFLSGGNTSDSVALWKSDGTEGGTQLVRSMENTNYFPPQMVAANGKLFFFIGNKLWESDGTKPGTHQVSDTVFSEVGVFFSPYLFALNNKLFLIATNQKSGAELYAATITPAAVTFVSAANGNWNTAATWVGNAVPPPGANVIVRHNVTGNINASCNSLTVEMPGSLQLVAGVNIIVAHY